MGLWWASPPRQLGKDAPTRRYLGTSVLWSPGAFAVPAACLHRHRDKGQQGGPLEEQNWQVLAKGVRFLCPTPRNSHLLHADLSQATQETAFLPVLQA